MPVSAGKELYHKAESARNLTASPALPPHLFTQLIDLALRGLQLSLSRLVCAASCVHRLENTIPLVSRRSFGRKDECYIEDFPSPQ